MHPALRTLGSLATNLVLAGFLGLFVFANVVDFRTTGDWVYLAAALNESTYVVLYLIRRRATDVSTRFDDWAVAFSGTFLSTLMRPAPAFASLLGDPVLIIGTLLNIAAVASLGRSLGIVPAKRRIKTGGAFRFLRHPMYASSIFTLAGYLLSNFSLLNLAIAICASALLVERLRREERLLAIDPAYRAYQERTPWRLLPFVY